MASGVCPDGSEIPNYHSISTSRDVAMRLRTSKCRPGVVPCFLGAEDRKRNSREGEFDSSLLCRDSRFFKQKKPRPSL
jgi:hypothetical protein